MVQAAFWYCAAKNAWTVSALNNGFGRAHGSAGTAINALVGINPAGIVFFADGADGAFALARTAIHACIGNLVCHERLLIMGYAMPVRQAMRV